MYGELNMVEEAKIGPLDVIRGINGEVERCDLVLSAKKSLEKDDYIVNYITDLDSSNPLNGREVIASGNVIVPAMRDVEGGIAIKVVVADQIPGQVVRGIYRGVSIMQGIPNVDGAKQNRLAHVIETHRVSYSTPLLNGREDIFYTYVCGESSAVLPVEPAEAHSLVDLKYNPSAAKIDQMIYDDAANPIDVVRALNRYFIRRLRYSNVQAHLTSLQLASYIESTGIFEDRVITATDMIVGDHPSDDEIASDSTFYYADQGIEFAPDKLAILQGYRRMRVPNGGKNEFYMAALKQTELYVRGEDAEGSRVTVPLKYIVEIA